MLSWLKVYVPPRPVVVVAKTLPLVSSSWTVRPGKPIPPPVPAKEIQPDRSADRGLKKNTLLCRLVMSVLASMTLANVFP